MTTKKTITPEIVKKIETSLEERKQKRDRRQSAAATSYAGIERRSGQERRKTGE